MINYQLFIQYFPEFAHHDQSTVEAAIALTECTVNNYEGIANPRAQQLALMLYIAHSLELKNMAQARGNGNIKSITLVGEGQVEFAPALDYSSLESTSYGVQLKQIVESHIIPFKVK